MNARAASNGPWPHADTIERRLVELHQEHEAGQAQLNALEQRTHELKNTMMRISGAITVLEELMAERRAMVD